MRRLVMTQFSGYIKFSNSESHKFVNLEGHQQFENPAIETVDLLQIWDKVCWSKVKYERWSVFIVLSTFEIVNCVENDIV